MIIVIGEYELHKQLGVKKLKLFKNGTRVNAIPHEILLRFLEAFYGVYHNKTSKKFN